MADVTYLIVSAKHTCSGAEAYTIRKRVTQIVGACRHFHSWKQNQYRPRTKTYQYLSPHQPRSRIASSRQFYRCGWTPTSLRSHLRAYEITCTKQKEKATLQATQEKQREKVVESNAKGVRKVNTRTDVVPTNRRHESNPPASLWSCSDDSTFTTRTKSRKRKRESKKGHNKVGSAA